MSEFLPETRSGRKTSYDYHIHAEENGRGRDPSLFSSSIRRRPRLEDAHHGNDAPRLFLWLKSLSLAVVSPKGSGNKWLLTLQFSCICWDHRVLRCLRMKDIDRRSTHHHHPDLLVLKSEDELLFVGDFNIWNLYDRPFKTRVEENVSQFFVVDWTDSASLQNDNGLFSFPQPEECWFSS